MTNILAFSETRLGELRRAGLETVTAARKVADATGGQVHAVLAGAPGIAQHAAKLAAYGADVVLVLEHDGKCRAAGLDHVAPRRGELVAARGALRVLVLGQRSVQQFAEQLRVGRGVEQARDQAVEVRPRPFLGGERGHELERRGVAHFLPV